jgi:hypothetical protein
MHRNGDKQTPVGRHIAGQEPDFVSYARPPRPHEIPEGRCPISRLAMLPSGPVQFSPDLLAKQILASPRDTVFFVDANIFFNDSHAPAWDALLQRRVAVTPRVLGELTQSWTTKPSANKHIHRVVTEWLDKKTSPVFELFTLNPQDPIVSGFFPYYMRLLVVRKRLWGIAEEQLRGVLGQAPSESQIHGYLCKHFGQRGQVLAKKGRTGTGDPAPVADEEMVLLAFVHALCCGTETVILSGDKDIEDQVYKLQWLLDTQYRAMLFAERWVKGDISLPVRPLDVTAPELAKAFCGSDAVIIEGRSPSLSEVLPEAFTPSLLYNWLVTGPAENMRFYSLAVCLEQEMRRLLWMKATTNGCNTNVLDGRNSHVWQRPLPLPDGCVVFARDVRYRVGDSDVPALDVHHALRTDERIGHLAISHDSFGREER